MILLKKSKSEDKHKKTQTEMGYSDASLDITRQHH